MSQLLARHAPMPVEYVAVNDKFGESGKPDELMKKFGLDSVDIIAAVERVMKRK